jgi:DNA-binding MarR family transcriptional regulator
MSDQDVETAAQTAHVSAEQPRPPAPTKAAQVLKLLARGRGATLADLTVATGWKPHTVRAHLTRLRQSGHTFERLERKSGPDAYHLVARRGGLDAVLPTVDTAAGNE